MGDYFWSARFITGALTLLMGLALLIGAALYLPFAPADARYELALGAALCLTGALLAWRARAGLAAYLAIFAAALIWGLLQVGLDIWLLLPRLVTPLLWGAVLFTLRHRIAPSRDPTESPSQRLRRARLSVDRFIRGHT